MIFGCVSFFFIFSFFLSSSHCYMLDKKDEGFATTRLFINRIKSGYLAASVISMNESALRQAPPTSAPSTSGSAKYSAALFGLTDPP